MVITELHNKQNNLNYFSKLWTLNSNFGFLPPSAQAKVDKQGKCKDSASGVAILLSKRMRRHEGSAPRNDRQFSE